MQLSDNLDPSKVYMSTKERRGYSLSRAILCSQDPKANCLEREVSDTCRRDTGLSGAGVTIPPEILWGENPRELRAMSVGVASAGGYLVGAEVMPLLGYLFPQSVIFRLGAQFLGGFGSNLMIPRVTSSTEAEWLAEAQAASGNHSSAFGDIESQPRRVYAERTISKQLLHQNAFGAELVKSLLMGAYAAAIDRGALVGTGGVQPLGLLNDATVPTVSSGTNGAAPTLAILNQVEGTVITAKAPMNAPGYVVSANARTCLKNTQKASGSSAYLLETVAAEDRVNGFTGHATTLLPDDGAKGSGTALGSALFGADWSTIAVTQFGGLDILGDIYTLVTTGKVIVSLNGYLDVTKRRPEAFAKVTDIVTA